MKKIIISIFIVLVAVIFPIASQGIFLRGVMLNESIQQISSGGLHSFAITNNDKVYAWGNNRSGRLGDGTTITRSRPTLITFSRLQAGETIESVDAGSSHSLAVTTNGRVYAWGSNYDGQLGDGTTIIRRRPTQITFSGLQAGETIRGLNAGSFHSLAVTTKGRVYAWGWNGQGQLGDGTTTQRDLPTLITFNGLQVEETIGSVVAGSSHSLAVTTKGRVYAWGYNYFGQLGDGTTTQRNTPTLITLNGRQWGETIRSVNAGYDHSFALSTNGRVYAWGRNSNGQLGDQTTVQRFRPSLISFSELQTGETIGSVNAGYDHSLAVTTNGRVYAWGSNGSGQLGDGTTRQRNTPTLITLNGRQGGEIIGSVNAGYEHSFGLTTNGSVYAWGWNGSQLGDGTIINRKIPTIIITNSLKTVLPEEDNPNFSLTIFETFLQKAFKGNL
jgi:alpha-tubulin suppressor-like RCC1 family protein